ncbi:hypothetical protein PPO43_00755 [Saprospira sp. CCB-QB6]|uniref:hypothetical protein n=1 Tax=Saprospira sp. CCB-QB6 TaxID=3023936 RepID=UPI002349383E|nr:hypothetical protein [Saprospira sp. CCB-QB6]WCL81625.1 hypothetical protein PPO43_00755 [Saprospira sp. CCB-QB6]
MLKKVKLALFDMLVASHNILLDEEGPLNETSCFILNAGPTTYGFRLNTSRVYFKEEEHSIYLARTESYVIAIGQKLFAFSMKEGTIMLVMNLVDRIRAIHSVQLGVVLVTRSSIIQLTDIANCSVRVAHQLCTEILSYQLKRDRIILSLSDRSEKVELFLPISYP